VAYLLCSYNASCDFGSGGWAEGPSSPGGNVRWDQPPQRIHPTSGRGGVKTAVIKVPFNLNGIATPDGTHPTGRRVTVLRTKIFGAVFTLIGLATAYFFVLLPIEE